MSKNKDEKCYKAFSDALTGVGRISFYDLKKQAEKISRSRRYGVIKQLDNESRQILTDMIASGKIKTMCENDKCNESFGDPCRLPVCDQCMIYPNGKISGFKRDLETGEFIIDMENPEPDPFCY